MKHFLFYVWNLWPPFMGAGITIHFVSKDMLFARTRLKSRFWTRNLVGTQFGGSIYAMTDPIYMAMLVNKLGPDYVVWDKSSTVRFRKPGRTDLWAEFQLSLSDIEDIKNELKTSEKVDWERDVLVKNSNGETVAEVHKVIHVSNRRPKATLET